MRSTKTRGRLNGFGLIELICAVLATGLLVVLVVPLAAQMRGDDWALVTRDHLRAYAVAHAEYIHDYGYLPPFAGVGDAGHAPGECSAALATETGLFDSPAAPVSAAEIALVGGFNREYVADPSIYTSPADEHFRFAEPGGLDCDNGRFGHLLLPSEDPQAAGATFTRLYFDSDDYGRYPLGYVGRHKLMPIDVGGLVEYRDVWLQSAEHVVSPADHVDLVEEDERSLLNNGLFVVPEGALPDPSEPANRITRRHPNDSGHVSYFDAHVDALERVTERYWEVQDDPWERFRLFWPTYR